jgi:transcriptional regulator, TetR family
MLYHYFGNKDDLFTKVLEDAYQALREHEAEVDLDKLPGQRGDPGPA